MFFVIYELLFPLSRFIPRFVYEYLIFSLLFTSTRLRLRCSYLTLYRWKGLLLWNKYWTLSLYFVHYFVHTTLFRNHYCVSSSSIMTSEPTGTMSDENRLKHFLRLCCLEHPSKILRRSNFFWFSSSRFSSDGSHSTKYQPSDSSPRTGGLWRRFGGRRSNLRLSIVDDWRCPNCKKLPPGEHSGSIIDPVLSGFVIKKSFVTVSIFSYSNEFSSESEGIDPTHSTPRVFICGSRSILRFADKIVKKWLLLMCRKLSLTRKQTFMLSNLKCLILFSWKCTSVLPFSAHFCSLQCKQKKAECTCEERQRKEMREEERECAVFSLHSPLNSLSSLLFSFMAFHLVPISSKFRLTDSIRFSFSCLHQLIDGSTPAEETKIYPTRLIPNMWFNYLVSNELLRISVSSTERMFL